jgi:hypothetical protein
MMFSCPPMSTSPDTVHVEDRLISVTSRWLGRHIETVELQRQIAGIGTEGLAPGQAEAVRELAHELERADPDQRQHLEMVARETVEVLALGE